MVVPAARATRIVTLPEFPEDDDERAQVLDAVAARELLPEAAPAYGFVAEAEVDGVDVVVIVYGSTSDPPAIAAAAFTETGELTPFGDAEPLDAHAMRFLHPLQHAVEQAVT